MSTQVNTAQLNPLYSKISNIILKKDGSTSYLDITLRGNGFCQFEKIEFTESLFELFPSGALVVRDQSDIITKIKIEEYDTIIITYLDQSKNIFRITSTAYLTNAASETEENFISINFTSHFYEFTQQNSLSGLKNTSKPQVYKLQDVYSDFTENILKPNMLETFEEINGPTLIANDETSNYVLYRPLNGMDYRIDAPNDNIIQYLYYLSSLACEKNSNSPRFLFWTGFENELYFKYFPSLMEDDLVAMEKFESNNFRYAVYSSDVPSQKIDGENDYKKIYALTAVPADQFVSKKYFYIRKTPKILNKTNGSLTPYTDLAYQFQDEGEKYDIEIISSDGTTDSVPAGADMLKYQGHWGYYDNLLARDSTSYISHIGQQFGSAMNYYYKDFMGTSQLFPFADNTNMWKNMFDLTPIHPNAPESSTVVEASETYLQKVMDIRWNAFTSTTNESVQLDLIRSIERQNFISYVLCCIAGEQEESFFAVITGYKPDPTTANGKNDEPLSYLYEWAKINYTGEKLDNPDENDYSINQIENLDFWSLDPNIRSNPDDALSWAINLNERVNNLSLFTEKQYAPGWYTKNLNSNTPNITYRPAGHDGGDLVTTKTQSRFLFVRMFKTPIKKILRDSGVTDPEVYSYYDGYYVYNFSAENITDGSCG